MCRRTSPARCASWLYFSQLPPRDCRRARSVCARSQSRRVALSGHGAEYIDTRSGDRPRVQPSLVPRHRPRDSGRTASLGTRRTRARAPARTRGADQGAAGPAGAFLAFLDARGATFAVPLIRESFPRGVDQRSVIGARTPRRHPLARRPFVGVRPADRPDRPAWCRSPAGSPCSARRRAWCAMAGNLETLVAGRVLQALSRPCSCLLALAMVEAFGGDRRLPRHRPVGGDRGRRVGLGPPLGGALVLSWGRSPSAFLVNLPFGVLALVATRRTVRGEPRARRPIPEHAGALYLAARWRMLNLGMGLEGNDWGCRASTPGRADPRAGRRPGRGVHAEVVRHRAPSSTRRSCYYHRSGARVAAYRATPSPTCLTNVLWLQFVSGSRRAPGRTRPRAGGAGSRSSQPGSGPLRGPRGYPVASQEALVWAGALVAAARSLSRRPSGPSWMPARCCPDGSAHAPTARQHRMRHRPRAVSARPRRPGLQLRQLGGVLGISILVAGDPQPGTRVSVGPARRLPVGGGVLVAGGGHAIGKVGTRPEAEESSAASPYLLYRFPAPTASSLLAATWSA